MEDKICLGQHNFISSVFPRYIKGFIWVGRQGTRITFEYFCCKFFQQRLKKKPEITSRECHNFMFSLVMFISCSFVSHYEYPKWSRCLLALHVGNYFHGSCGAVCLATALTSVIMARNCFVKPITLGYSIVSLNCTTCSSCLNRAYFCFCR